MISKPYLQLRDRLSQIWINKYTIILVLVALKLILFHTSLQSSLDTSKDYTLNSCPTIDSFASTAVSIPHYLSKSANSIILKSMQEINDQTKNGLSLIVTGSENIVIFAIEMVIGTYACLLVSAIDGAVDVAVNATESIITWVNDTLGDITDEIEEGLTDISDFINDIVNAAEDVADFFTGDDDPDDGSESIAKVNLAISSLKNIGIPSSVTDKLEALKENTPDFDTVKNKTENLIKIPFELIKDKISNATFIDDNDSDLLYTPPITESTICSDNTGTISKFYDDIAKDISVALKVIVVLLILGALLALVPLAYEEYRTWKKIRDLQNDIQMAESEGKSKGIDPIDSYERIFNKYPTRVGLLLSSRITPRDEQKETTIRWVIAYILSSRSLIVLGISLVGVLAVALQFIILVVLSRSIGHYKTSFDSMTTELTDDIAYSVSNWTESTNSYIDDKETSINEELFSWVKEASDSINDTISAFVDEMNEAIADAFNGTILYDPIKTVVGCVIEDKLIKIEEGLTWIYDNAEITLPRVNDTYITEGLEDDDGSSTTDSLVSKASDMVDGVEDMMSNLLALIIKQYKKSLLFELYISLTIFGVWFIQIFIALIICWYDGKFGDGNEVINEGSLNRSDLTLNETRFPDISYPRQLTNEEKAQYGYPFSAPVTAAVERFKSRDLTGNGVQACLDPNNPFNEAMEDPFKDDRDVGNPFNDQIEDSLYTYRPCWKSE